MRRCPRYNRVLGSGPKTAPTSRLNFGEPMTKWVPLLFLAISSVAAAPTIPQTKNSADIVLAHVTIIDVTGGPTLREMSVLIAGNRISKVIDASGKFLIPGLWDMHVHPNSPQDLSLFIANGITGIRIMWGDREDFASRKERDAGRLL